MSHECKGWTIKGKDGRGKLVHASNGTIHFGNGTAIAAYDKIPLTTVDLTPMDHGVNEIPQQTVECFIAAADLINKELTDNKLVAVHCKNGRSRTGFVLITFLVRHGNFSHKEACDFVSLGMGERLDFQRQGLKFDVNKIGLGDGSYNQWLIERNQLVKKADNAQDIRQSHVVTTPLSNSSKTTHKVFSNISRRGNRNKLKQEIVKPKLRVQMKQPQPRRIRPSELALLKAEAEAFKKWP